jgi:phospholipase C
MASLDHIIVLMMENHSFDRMLGALLPYRPDGGGIVGMNPMASNDDNSPTPLMPINHVMAPTTTRLIHDDPMHDFSDVAEQIKGPNLGYVTNYARTYPTTAWQQRQEIMGYYDVGKNDIVPNLHALAKQYTICDRWFSSLPGPTFANRVFMHTGTSRGYTTNSPANAWTQTSIYDVLGNNGIPWAIYYSDLSSSVLLQPMPLYAYRIRDFRDALSAPAKNFPRYCFLEPNYGVYSNTSENDQHPMSDVTAGDKFIGEVYNALRKNDELWQSSLLVIVYDEHGGFYDHVLQPPTIPPDDRRDASGFDFKKLGVRVPAVVVSPWLDQGVISDTFDHTSLLKFVIEQFGLPLDYLGNRVSAPTTNTLTKYLRKSPRSTYGQLPATKLAPIDVPDDLPQSDLQQALIASGHQLATQISDPSIRRSLTSQTDLSPRAQGLLAVEQFEAYLTDRAKQQTTSLAALTAAAAAKPRKAKVRTKAPTKAGKTTAGKAKARKTAARSTKPRNKRRSKK